MGLETTGVNPHQPRSKIEMNDKNLREVLDHGYVRLVDHMGNDLSVVRSARVSHDADWRAGEDEGKDEKLIGYLMNNRHTTPFECVTFTFEVKAPIFVFRQWHRHRTQSYNELSARYSELPEEYYVPEPKNIGTQSEHTKQARSDESLPEHLVDTVPLLMHEHNTRAFILYRNLLEHGVPRELARSVLPVATYSRMFCTMNLHNLFHFLGLRMDKHAQWEIREYANAMYDLIYPIVPISCDTWFKKFMTQEQ
jgi:thymidylate synthase (FAD)